MFFMFLASPASAIDWKTETVDDTDDVGYYTSLALDDSGQAHISYMDFTNYHLKYADRDKRNMDRRDPRRKAWNWRVQLAGT